jgi:methyl-accepting chemotaxis protein
MIKLSTRLLACLPLALLLQGCAQKPLASLHYPLTPRVAPLPVAVAPVAPPDEVSPLLAYHQSLRRMTQGELLKELSGITLQQRTPKITLQTGMILMLTRGGGDLARAQSIFDSVANATEPEADGLKPLAQLLSSHCAEARRLADSVDRLNAQLRDTQRKSDQLSDTLEALKAIERGLPVRPTSGASAGGR